MSQAKKGGKYSELQPVYSLNLVNDIFVHDTPDFIHNYRIVHDKDSNKVIEGLHFTFIELPKFTPHSIADKRMMVLWLRFLTEINSNTKEVPSDLLNDPEIGKAVEELEISGFTDAELRAYDKFWDSVSVERTLLDDRYQKGMEKGMEKGIAEGLEMGMKQGLEKGKAEGKHEANTNRFSALAVTSRASSIEWHTTTSGAAKSSLRVTTTFRRPGNAPFGSESNVLRPMMMGLPIVTDLKCFKSAGRWHRSPPLFPIAPFSAITTIAPSISCIVFMILTSYRGAAPPGRFRG